MSATGNQTPKRVVPKDLARQGETSGHVRWVLRISLALAVIAGVVLWSMYFL
jgi:hypothetical protein